MDHEMIRKGVAQANFNQEHGKVLYIEGFVISLIAGFNYNSFAIGALVFFSYFFLFTLCAMYFWTNLLVNISLSGVWAIYVFLACRAYHVGIFTTVCLALLTFMISWGSRMTGFDHCKDLSPH